MIHTGRLTTGDCDHLSLPQADLEMTRDAQMNKPSAVQHWVLIETGANQRYIFDSNRLRHVVGASQIVHEVGTVWVPDAVDGLGLSPDSVVMTASGKALLLVESAAAGRAVIREVTGRALKQAPGLRVTGAVGPQFDPTDDAAHEPAQVETYRRHARARAARPSPQLRDRVFPWHRLCRDTGQPAAGEEAYGDEDPVPASAEVLARSKGRDRARCRLVEKLGGRLAVVVPAHLDELRHSGWVAVVHADGNGVGGLFRGFLKHVAQVEGVKQVPLMIHTQYQRDVAKELDTATWDAVHDAIAALLHDRQEDKLAGRLLPLVVGGDDVTVACDAALAVPFVQAFADAFARHTARQRKLSNVAKAATGHAGLTASAGIAVVKSHHPFATSYALAEALTVSAKRFKYDGRALAGFDIHVAHTSTLRDLATLREYVRPHDGPGKLNTKTRIARYAGPYLLDRVEDLPEGLRHRSVRLLEEIIGWLEPDGWLSAAQAHALREAADRSLAEYRFQLDLTVRQAPDPARVRELLDVQSDGPVADDAGDEFGIRKADADPPGGFLRLFDALHLRGLRLDSSEPSIVDASSIPAGGAR